MIGYVKALSVITGAVILAAVAHVNVMAAGGYGEPGTPVALAIPAAVAVMSIALGFAVGEQRYTLATLSFLFLAAGEIATFATTAERLTNAREDQQRPIIEATARHNAARARLDAAERSDMVEKAETTKVKIDAHALETSAAPSCKQVCKETLAATTASAQADLDRARAAAERELTEARAELTNSPLPGTVSPLAARLGWPVWVLDLTHAGLASLATSGLAACLLCFGAHGSRQKRAAPKINATIEQPPAGNVHEYVVDRVTGAAGTEVDFRDLYLNYADWCRAKGALTLAPTDFGERLAQLCDGTDVKSRRRGKAIYITNIQVAHRPEAISIG